MSDWLTEYQVGSFIDSRDTMNTWCLGKILDINRESKIIKVRYEGWSEKWDNHFYFLSNRIAPFRKNSELYTGQKGTALRDFAFSLEDIQSAEQKLEDLPKTPFEITQFLRGELFTLVDCLLVHEYKNKEDLDLVVRFFMKVIDFIVNWIKAGQEHFNIINEGLNFMESPRAALSAAWPELLFTLKRLFGQDIRTAKHLSTWTAVPNDYVFSPCTESRPRTMYFLINYFAKQGGLESILSLLSEKDELKKPLFKFVSRLPVFEMRFVFSPDFEKDWMERFKNLVVLRIQNISEKEIKGLDKDIVSDLILNLKTMLGESQENWDLVELGLALKLLRCPYMEKQLKGLAEIKEIVEYVNNTQLGKRYSNLDPEVLANWLLENRILETIIENSHEEMVKRTSSLFIFLASTKKINNSLLDILWTYSQGHHDSLQMAAYQVIIDISSWLDQDHQLFLWEKFASVNPEEYTEKFLQTFCDFSFKTKELSQKSMKFIYGQCFENPKPKIVKSTCESFEKLLMFYRDEEVVLEYISSFLENIKKLESVCQSMKMLIKILKMKIPIYIENIHSKLKDLQPGVVSLITDSFSQLLDPSQKLAFTVHENIETRLKFWKNLTKKKLIPAEEEDIKNLQSLVSKPEMSPDALSLFSSILLKLIQRTFSPEAKKEILESLYLNREFSEVPLTEANFEVFHELFMRVNEASNNLVIRFSQFHSRKERCLIGMDFIISCIFQSSNPVIVSKATNMLISLNLKFAFHLYIKREEIWKDLLRTLQDYLQKTPDQVQKSLSLVLLFLEHNKKKEEHFQDNCAVHFKRQGEEYNKILANTSNTLLTIRKKIADYYKKPYTQVLLINTQTSEKFDYLFDDVTLNSFRSPFTFLIEILQTRLVEPNPIEFFSTCQDFHENLLGMLPSLDPPSAELAWGILSKVNLIEKHVNRIKDHEVQYSEIFNTQSLHNLVYNLKIIKKLLKNQDWESHFISESGHLNLLSIYLNHTFQSDNTLTLEYNTVIISILWHFTKTFLSDFHKLIHKILDSLVQVASSCKETRTQIITHSKDIFSCLRTNNISLFEAAFKSYAVKNLIFSVFLNCSNDSFSCEMISFLTEQSDQVPSLKLFFLQEILDISDLALNTSSHSNYWLLLQNYIKSSELTPEFEKKYLSFFAVLESRPAEQSSKDQDGILFGVLKVLNTIVTKVDLDVNDELTNLLLHKCLFEIPSEANRTAPKCKHFVTRKEAFSLLKELCVRSPTALLKVTEYLSYQYQDPSWRSGKSADWNYHPRAQEKSGTGFVGIKNLGCICYMISVLQQLFFVHYFRETILTTTKSPDSGQQEALEENLLHQLQYIYSALKYSDKQSVNPKGICKAFKDWEGRPVNVLEQMDADEFINTFMDRIETQIKGTDEQDIIKKLFTGQLATEIIGQKGCSHRSEVNEAFITLPVQVKNKKNLIESLNSFKEGEILEGSNAYQCDHCESKVTAIRRVCIKYLPNTLFITLRRFEFDYDSMKRLKLNDFCNFPMTIDLEDYTQEGIERLELLKEKENAFIEGKEFSKQIPGRKYSEDYYKFHLRGIIIHMGNAEGGHYYSFIKDSDQWYEFNDTLVRKISQNDIPAEAFGGEEKYSFYSSTGVSSGIKSKTRNAYILLYEREQLYHYSKEEESLKLLTITVKEKSQVFNEVKEENEKYWRCRSSFSPEYFDFISELNSKNDEKIQKFVISFFLTILIRSRDYPRIASCISTIKEQLKESQVLSEWVLELASFKYNLKELLMDCPNTEKRRIIVGLIYSALKNSRPGQQESFFKRVLSYLDLAAKPHSYHFCQYFELIFKVLGLDPSLIKRFSITDRLMSYLKKTAQPDLGPLPEFTQTDIYLGYDKYQPEEQAEKFAPSSSVIFLISSLSLCNSELNEEQISYFFEDSTLTELLCEAETRYGGKVLGQFYSSLSRDNKDYSIKYGSFLINGVDKTNHDKHKPYMRQLFWILESQDSVAEEKTENLMNKFMKQLLDNKRFPLATDSSVDFLIKISAKIPLVRDWLFKKKNEYRWLENILTDPVRKKKEPGRSFASRNEALKQIIRGSIDEADYEDSEGEVLEENLQKGTEVEYLDFQTQRWVPCTVFFSEGPLLFLKSESEGFSKWTENLSDFIRGRNN